jgi:(p)ppGpp synthase/HD superfamily hydrolase
MDQRRIKMNTTTQEPIMVTKLTQQMRFEKLKTKLRGELMGRASRDPIWFITVHSFNLAEKYHTGFRKDGSPEFIHQIEIALYLLTMEKLLLDPARTIAATLLHDLGEDYGDLISFEEIGDETDEIVEGDCRLLSKQYRGEKKPIEEYMAGLSTNCRVSIVKGADRIHNLRTMRGVFTFEKQVAYCDETDNYFFGFLKKARRAFPEQEPVYENIKFLLNTQLEIYRSGLSKGVAV